MRVRDSSVFLFLTLLVAQWLLPTSVTAEDEFPRFCSRVLTTSEKIDVRKELTKIFEPIGIYVNHLKDTPSEEILSWFNAYPEVSESVKFKNRTDRYVGNPPISTLQGIQDHIFHGHFLDHESPPISIHAHSFYVGSTSKNIPLMTKVILSLKYLAAHTTPTFSFPLTEEEKNALKKYSFTQLELNYAMEFVYLSYAQAISLLSVNRPDRISEENWLKVLLLPEEGEKLSLVERLAIVLKPGVLGYYSTYGMYVENPLVLKGEKWVFSKNFKIYFRESQEIWKQRTENKNVLVPSFELGTGCPAAFCHSEKQSSLRSISEALLHVLKVVDQHFSKI